MLLWIIQTIIISVTIIFLVHHLIQFFTATLTVPKIKDLVNSPIQKYENIYKIIENKQPFKNNEQDYSLIDLLPKTETSEQNLQNSTNYMKNELKMFLKDQLNKSTDY